MPPPTQQTVNNAIDKVIARSRYTYNEYDAIRYALGIGAASGHWYNDDLKFVYERSSDFQVLPTFAVVFARNLYDLVLGGKIEGIEYDSKLLLHGEQQLELFGPLPRAATVESTCTIADIQDKGSGLLMVIRIESNRLDGAALAVARFSIFIRGIGGFDPHRRSGAQVTLPHRKPDAVNEATTLPTQALLYRLAGDANPLHADPRVASIAGYPAPIMHGLCVYGFAARAVLRHFCENEAGRLRGLDARFSNHVFPGEALITEMWRLSAQEVGFRTRVKERNTVALDRGRARISD